MNLVTIMMPLHIIIRQGRTKMVWYSAWKLEAFIQY